MSRTKIRLAVCFTLICWIAAAVPASAQHFQQMKGSLTQIAAGRNEVWGLNGPAIYRFHPGTKTFVQVSGALSQIAVGGGSLLRPDEVWGTDGQDVWRFNLSTNSRTLETPGVNIFFNQVAVGEGDEDASA
jgi:Tectonin domain